MQSCVSLRQLSYSTPDHKPLFTDLDLSFGPRRTGLIGRNGTGKSTLLKLISGDLVPSSGSVSLAGRIAMLDQSPGVTTGRTVADAFGVRAALEALAGSNPEDLDLDWSLPARLDVALAATGISGLTAHRDLATLSGGEQMRVAMAALVFGEPEVIVLDEPTNNLDAKGRHAVIRLLRRWRGAVIVASHDRALLEHVDTIVELSSLGARTYGGNWSDYETQRNLEREATGRIAEATQRTLRQLERSIQARRESKARRDSAGKQRAGKGDLPRILVGKRRDNAEKTGGEQARIADRQRQHASQALADAQAEVERLTALKVALSPTGLPDGRTILDVEEVSGGPDSSAPIVRNLSFSIMGPERVAIVGPNGSGKTSLLRMIVGELMPTSGAIRLGGNMAMLDQSVRLLEPGLSIRDNFRRLNAGSDENACRAALARFLFRADAALQLAGTLSGGERLRAGLACVLGGGRPPDLLILDEPTNHLDIAAIEAVESGLRAFDGALIVVSHDARFLENAGISRHITMAST